MKKGSVEEYIGTLDGEPKKIVSSVRDIVLGSSSGIEESIKWGSIAFHYKGTNICAYRVGRKHVTLQFMSGAQLSDPHGLLQGTGTKARGLRIAKKEDVDPKAVKAFVKESVSIAKSD